jgi:hypothetical protein
MRRIVLLAAALTIPASALSVALTSGPASASGPKGKSVCTTVSGSISSGTITISGCTDINGATTGGGTGPISFAALASGGTVSFLSGDTMTFSAPHLANPSAHKCPGYVKGAATNPTATKFQGTVTAATAGLHLPGKIIGEVCIGNDANGTITNPKALKIS